MPDYGAAVRNGLVVLAAGSAFLGYSEWTSAKKRSPHGSVAGGIGFAVALTFLVLLAAGVAVLSAVWDAKKQAPSRKWLTAILGAVAAYVAVYGGYLVFAGQETHPKKELAMQMFGVTAATAVGAWFLSHNAS